jgi:hypothetical protein
MNALKYYRIKTLSMLQEIVNTKYDREFSRTELWSLLTFNLPIFWSWGVNIKKVVAFNNSIGNHFDTIKGLVFPVEGNHHKGYVIITLSFDDTFCITFLNKKYKEVKEIKGIYFDQLVSTIDTFVEKIPDYAF